MPRYRHAPLTFPALACDGPAVRVRDLVAMSGLSADTVCLDIRMGHLRAYKRAGGANAPYFIQRHDARRYLAQLGFHEEQIAVSA
jgi:hypothetical protein